MAAWKSFGILSFAGALSGLAACGLSEAGELDFDAGPMDTGFTGPSFDGGGGTPDSSKPTKDATSHEDAKKDTGPKGKDSAADTSSHADGTTPKEASSGHEGGGMDGAAGADAGHDAGEDATGAKDAAPDTSSADASEDAGPPDAAIDTGTGGVDAAQPPSSCGFPSYTYSCGSKSCGCNQLCDDGASCGACLPHFGTCTLDLHDCDSDFSSATSCGGCGNVCCLGLGTCSLSGGTYSCEPCL